MNRREKVLIFILFGLLILPVAWYKFNQSPKESASTPQITQPDDQSDDQDQQPKALAFDKTRYSLTDPASIWVVVNKKRSLPAGHVPGELTTPNIRLRLNKNDEQMKLNTQTARALEELFAAAARESHQLVLSSGYRSEALQRQFYNGYVARDGQTAADRYSARPGTSEHQTGFAADLTDVADKCHLEVCFGSQPEGKWLAANAHKYGFIIRYPEGKEAVTGYQYEPWHLRYVGQDLATEMHDSGVQTLEEFFNLPAAPSY